MIPDIAISTKRSKPLEKAPWGSRRDAFQFFQKHLSGRHTMALLRFTDLVSENVHVGRITPGSGLDKVSNGTPADYNESAIAALAAIQRLRLNLSDADADMIVRVAIMRQTISDLARLGQYGANRARVKDKLTSALERLSYCLGMK